MRKLEKKLDHNKFNLMRKKTFLIVILIFLFQRCGILDKVEVINSSLNFIPESSYSDSNKDFNKSTIDSIKNILLVDKMITLPIKFEGIVAKLNETKDTTQLTNIYTNARNAGVPLTFQYNVKKNDVIYYEIENISNNRLKKVELVEGSSTRYRKENLKGKTKSDGFIEILTDNILVLNIDDTNFLKNKGLFNAKLKINIKKISPEINISSTFTKDTIFEKRTIVGNIADTIPKLEIKSNFLLESKANISYKNIMKLPLKMEKIDNQKLLGWSYWIGLKSSDSLDISNNSENVLSNYMLNEIVGESTKLEQLESKNNDVSISINNKSLDRRSLNYGKNYAFFISDDSIINSEDKGEILLVNNSNLYDYDLEFILYSLKSQEFKKVIEKDIPVIKDFIKIKVIEDE